MKIFTILILLSTTLGSYESSWNRLLRIIGEWHQENDKNIIVEKWQNVSNFTLEGYNCLITKSNDDTLAKEYLRLIRTNGDIFLISKVSHNALPVSFKLINDDINKFVFENEGHDFPQRIIYDLSKKNIIRAYIEGYNQEADSIKRVDFLFERFQN